MRSAKLQPDNFNVHYLLGTARVSLGRRDEGLIAWRAALALQPTNYKLLQVMAVEYGKGGYFREAAEAAQRSLELREDPNAYFIAINALQDAADFASSGEIAQRAVEKWPDSARANFEHGFHLHKNGRVEQAVEYLKKAMAADPKYEARTFGRHAELLLPRGRVKFWLAAGTDAVPAIRPIPARIRPKTFFLASITQNEDVARHCYKISARR